MDDMAREFGAAIVRGVYCVPYATCACLDCAPNLDCPDCPHSEYCGGPIPLDYSESDSISACDYCSTFLDVTLTPDGARDLFEGMRERAKYSRAQRDFQQARWAAAAAQRACLKSRPARNVIARSRIPSNRSRAPSGVSVTSRGTAQRSQ